MGLAGASDDDPGGLTTYSQTGARFGYALAWTLVFTYPLMTLLSTLGFVAYGLYLLRNHRARADGGLTKPVPSRVR